MASNPSISTTSKSLQELYTNKHYEQFIHRLSQEKGKFSDGTYHYNLGTVYLKMGRHSESRYHLEKALQEGYLHSGTRKNLDTAVKNLNLATMEESRYLFDKVLSCAMRSPPDLALSLALILAVFFTALFRFHKIKKISLIIALIASFCPFIFTSSFHRFYRRAIVLEESFIYEGPSRSFEVSSDAPSGLGLIVGRKAGDWFYVEAPGHFSGWIDRKRIGIL